MTDTSREKMIPHPVRFWTGFFLCLLTSPLWILIVVITFAWKIGENLSEYLLDDMLADRVLATRKEK